MSFASAASSAIMFTTFIALSNWNVAYCSYNSSHTNSRFSTEIPCVASSLLNRSAEAQDITFYLNAVGMNAEAGYTMRDLWAKKDYKRSTAEKQTFKVPAHGVVVLRLSGTSQLYNVFGYK